MPTLSRWMIRLALINFATGMTLAALLLSYKGVPDLLPTATWRWVWVHVDILLVGWMVQLSMGVAYWIMPRLPHTLKQRGRFGFALTATILLNAGTGFFAIGVVETTLTVLGLCLQLGSIIAFAIHIYPRVRPVIVPHQRQATSN